METNIWICEIIFKYYIVWIWKCSLCFQSQIVHIIYFKVGHAESKDVLPVIAQILSSGWSSRPQGHLKCAYEEAGERLFIWDCSDRTRGNVLKLKNSKFRLGIRKDAQSFSSTFSSIWWRIAIGSYLKFLSWKYYCISMKLKVSGKSEN